MILCADYLIPVTTPPLKDGAITIQDDRIVAVGSRESVRQNFPHLPLRQFKGCVLMPGLVNAHTHLELTKLRGSLPATDDFISWVLGLIAARKEMAPHDYEAAAVDGVAQSLAAGTTCLGEVSTTTAGLRAMMQGGMRGILFLEVLGRTGAETAVWMDQVEKEVSALRAQTRPPVIIGLSPHAPYTLSEERLRALGPYLESEALRYAIHIAESPIELEYFLHHKGPIKSRLFPAVGWEDTPEPGQRVTPLAHIAGTGLLTERLLLIHGVHLSEGDMDLVHQARTKVAVCPRSNDHLGVGLPPLRRLEKKGITLALGTDSLASSDSLSLWDEMRFICKQYGHDDTFSPASLLRMATLGGAEALGLGTVIGSLEPGKAADLVVVSAPVTWGHDLIASLIEGTGPDHIHMVMIAGRTVMDRTTRT